LYISDILSHILLYYCIAPLSLVKWCYDTTYDNQKYFGHCVTNKEDICVDVITNNIKSCQWFDNVHRWVVLPRSKNSSIFMSSCL